jgi:hypothetical protein
MIGDGIEKALPDHKSGEASCGSGPAAETYDDDFIASLIIPRKKRVAAHDPFGDTFAVCLLENVENRNAPRADARDILADLGRDAVHDQRRFKRIVVGRDNLGAHRFENQTDVRQTRLGPQLPGTVQAHRVRSHEQSPCLNPSSTNSRSNTASLRPSPLQLWRPARGARVVAGSIVRHCYRRLRPTGIVIANAESEHYEREIERQWGFWPLS